MKTYCKNLVLADKELIYKRIEEYMHDKYRKSSSVRFFANYAGESRAFIRENFRPGKELWEKILMKIASEMEESIRTRTVREHLLRTRYGEPLIRYRKINDKGSGKERVLGLETIPFRLYEALAQKESEPLFNAKVGAYQCASIKKRGQNYGKKAVKKWMSGDVEGTKFNAKADIKKCYPSMKHEKVLGFLRRDLRKSPDLLYLYETFLGLYEEWPSPEAIAPDAGILIGSPVSKDLCNYFLSYAYHYASEQLVKTTCRRGQEKTKRLIKHIIFYADDIVMYSGNKRDLRNAVESMVLFMKEKLELTIKPNWIISRTMYEDAAGRRFGKMLDYMGFRFHGGGVHTKRYARTTKKLKDVWVTVRKNIFLTARRKMAKVSKKLKRHEVVSAKFAMSVASSFGWFKNTNMYRYRDSKKVDLLMKVVRKIISDDSRGKKYDEAKYYKMWRRYYYA